MGTEAAGAIVREYHQSDREGVLALLYALHGPYKQAVVPPRLRQFGEDKDMARAYSEYLDIVTQGHGDQYMTFVVEDGSGHIVGVIIGSIEDDKWDVLTPIGLLEDWFVVDEHRGSGVGGLLYRELEEWFRGKGCRQIKSDTWITNHLSRDVHAALGFIEYGVDLRKRL